MSMHKLTAGSGYDYLTRQVARNDAAVPGRTPLADYYDEKGEAPGVWVGSGLAGIDGLAEGDPVTAEQMAFLFGKASTRLCPRSVSPCSTRTRQNRIGARPYDSGHRPASPTAPLPCSAPSCPGGTRPGTSSTNNRRTARRPR